MAMNPMQRRARNAFLIGFLIAAIAMALIVIALLFRMKTLNETIESLKSVQKQCYVASQDLTSGQALVFDEHFEMATVQTTMDTSTIISSVPLGMKKLLSLVIPTILTSKRFLLSRSIN